MRVLVAMSGGVDSSVAAALAADRYGTDAVVGATLKLWGGASDSGCCSVADVEDARRVADHLGLVHHVFNFAEAFERHVVTPYVEGHAAGTTPNPCIECNRTIKFDRLLGRARALGFDAVATGHHARVETGPVRHSLCRGADADKDQSYVLAMLTQDELGRTLFPVGGLTKAEVRAEAARRGLRTADKPDSQDVCFIRSDEGRARFLGDRTELHSGRVVDRVTGVEVGTVDAVELVTIGQRRGMGHGTDGRRRYVTSVDVPGRRIEVGPPEANLTAGVAVHRVTWVDEPWVDGRTSGGPGRPVVVQCTAHGHPVEATVCSVAVAGSPGPAGEPGELSVRFGLPQRRVAPGQTIAFYDPDRPERVVGSGVVLPEPR